MMQKICKDCFSDKEIRGFISSQAILGSCDCCNSNNIEVLNVEELFDFFKELLDNFQLDNAGETLLSKIQGNWSLFSSQGHGYKILNFIISKIDTTATSADELVDFTPDIKENINHWNILKEQLKWERRYLTDINYLIEDLGWDGFFNSKIAILKEDEFFRARLHYTELEDPYSSNSMFCPPKEMATAGRANPLGIPFLYLSDNKETILYEIRASYLDEVSVGTFSIKQSLDKDILISDFTESPTLFHPSRVKERIKSTLLKRLISRDLSKPMRRYDSDLDYIPTQFICEFIKVYTGVQGIKFRSSLHVTGNNVVIFDQDIMECKNVEKVQISKLTIASKVHQH